MPEPPAPEKKETFAAHLPAVIASAAVTVGMTFLASFLGTAGTLGGLLLGPVITGTGSWYGERGIRLAAARAKARREAAARRGRPLTETETGLIDMRAEQDQRRKSGRGKRLPLAVAGAIAACALVAGVAVTGLTAAATGKTVAQVVRGQPPAPETSRRPEHSPTPSLPPGNTPSTANSGSGAVPAPSVTPDPSPDLAPAVPTFPGSGVPASSPPAGSPAAQGSP